MFENGLKKELALLLSGKTIVYEDYVEAYEYNYTVMLQVHEYVTKTLGQKSVIVDADDLKQDPGKTWATS